MRNPFAITPGGELIPAHEAATMPLDHDWGCPTCSQPLQLLGRHSTYPGFPRFEHRAEEAAACDKLVWQRTRSVA